MNNHIDEYNTLEWGLRRLQILEKKGWICSKCKTTSNLSVHHNKYDSKLKVWEYPDEYLEVLCWNCHRKHHDTISNDSLYLVERRIKKYKLDKILLIYFKNSLGISKNINKDNTFWIQGDPSKPDYGKKFYIFNK